MHDIIACNTSYTCALVNLKAAMQIKLCGRHVVAQTRELYSRPSCLQGHLDTSCKVREQHNTKDLYHFVDKVAGHQLLVHSFNKQDDHLYLLLELGPIN